MEGRAIRVRIRVFQTDCEVIDFVHHAGVRRPIRCQRAGWQSRSPEARNGYVRIVYFQIDEVPILGLLVMVAAIVAVSIFVRPGGLTGKIVRSEIVRICFKHCVDFVFHRWFEIILGDERDCLVSTSTMTSHRSRRRARR
jgi:hypothetical protein